MVRLRDAQPLCLSAGRAQKGGGGKAPSLRDLLGDTDAAESKTWIHRVEGGKNASESFSSTPHDVRAHHGSMLTWQRVLSQVCHRRYLHSSSSAHTPPSLPLLCPHSQTDREVLVAPDAESSLSVIPKPAPCLTEAPVLPARRGGNRARTRHEPSVTAADLNTVVSITSIARPSERCVNTETLYESRRGSKSGTQQRCVCVCVCVMLLPQPQQRQQKQMLLRSSCGSRCFTCCDVSFLPVRNRAHGGRSCAKCQPHRGE